MSVNEKLMAPGTFSVNLSLEATPNSIINKIIPWGNIVLTPTRVTAEEFTDAQLRDMARYVGIVQSQTITEEGIEIGGSGILTYLGDSDSRGMVLARNAGTGAVRSFNADTLNDVLDRTASTPYGILRDESGNQRAVRKGTVTEVSFDDTVLLLNFEGSDGDTTTSDGSAYTSNQVITFHGTSDISSDQAKYGSTSLNLSTDGYLLVADRPELDLTYRNFTIEWWEYRTSSSGNPTVIARNDSTYSPWIAGKLVNGNNTFWLTNNGTSWDIANAVSMGSIDLNQWNHFAVSRKGDNFRTYKNGTKVSEFTNAEAFVRVSSDSLQIGKAQSGNFFQGYLDGLVITRGTAKYWDNFTPSTSAPTATTANKTYTGKHYLESAYRAIKTICTSLDAEFKMNNDGTIDVGPRSSLFTGHESSTPQGMIVRRLSGPDPNITGYSGVDLSTEFNAEDYVSRVELTASQVGAEINLGQADAKDVPYKDLFGNTLERIQILAENDIPDSMRDIRAEAYLNEYNKIQKTLNVGLEDYDISGDIGVGDIIYVYDPDVGFEDTSVDAALENRDRFEITYQGQILHPIKIRVMGLSFPISDDMGVFYRDKDGVYTDLTDYVVFETGITQIEVGQTTKTINQDLRASGSVIAIGSTNEFTVPDAPTSFAVATGTYQDGSGRPFAFARLTWNEPTNTDGSRITDGNMYRVRYRQVTDVDGNNLIDSNDNQVTDYEYLTVNFGTTAAVIKGLGPSNTYEFGVACIDNSGFSGGFAVLTATQMPVDATVPPQPTAPTGTYGSVASNATKVQVIHNLGAAKDSDGNPIASPTNFTLPRDIDHLNVYRGTTSDFTISSNNYVGEIQARAGHIDGSIPAINTFAASTSGTAYYRVTAVDVAGNESDPSTAVSVQEELISTAYIDDAAITTAKINNLAVTDAKIDTLTASKITGGTIEGKEIIINTDNDDPSNPVLGTIRSNNYVQNTDGWIIKSDGSVEFESGAFRGDITGASGTFSGSLAAGISISAPVITGGSITGTSGTFTGDISGASGTFTGDLSGANISGGTIDIGGSDSTSFHVDTDGNMWLGAGSIGSAPFQVSNAGAITATSGTIGGWTIGSTDLSSGNISIDSTGSITGNYTSGSAGWSINSDGTAEFNNVTVRGTLDGPNLTGTLTGGTSGSIRVGDTGDELRIIEDSTSGGFLAFYNGGYNVATVSYDGSSLFEINTGQNSSSTFADLALNSGGGDLYLLADNIRLKDNPMGIGSGSNAPVLWLWNGSAYERGQNNVLGTDSNGNLEWTTVASSPVTSISGAGEITVTESSGAYTIEHADSDHNGSFASATDYLNHVGNSTAHGTFDNYGSWTAKAGGNNMTVQSGNGVEWKAGTGISLSVNTNPYEITINNTATGSSGVTSVSGSNSSSSDGRFMRSTALAVGGTTLYYYTSTRGDDLTIQGQRPTSNNTSSVGLSATQYNEVHARYGYFDFITGANVSSQDVKTDITDLDLGLDFINALAPKKYKYKPELKEDDGKYGFGFIAEEIEALLLNQGESNSKLHQDGHTDYPNYGRCAHELVCNCEDPECCPDPVLTYNRETEEWTEIEGCDKDAKCTMPCCTDIAGTTIDGINYVHATEEECETEFIDGRKYASVMKEELIAPLVKAVQELSTQISDLTARVEALEG